MICTHLNKTAAINTHTNPWDTLQDFLNLSQWSM